MRSCSLFRLPATALAGWLLLQCPPPCLASKPFVDEASEPRGIRFLRPSESNPADQLEHADDLREAGRLRRAHRQYRALIRYWPNTPEAAQAHLARARLLEQRGRWTRSFEQYEQLLESYAGEFDHQEVLEQLFDMAMTLRDHRRAQFLFFPGFHAPERALPLLERIVQYGPRWSRAPEAQLEIGRIQMQLNRPEEAVLSFERVQTRYPGSPQAKQAAIEKAYAQYDLFQKYPNDLDGAETAFLSLALFVQEHPESEHAERARERMQEIRRHRAEKEYQKARYYDRIAREPQAALVVYEQFLRQFSDSDRADRVRDRIEVLRAKLEQSDD